MMAVLRVCGMPAVMFTGDVLMIDLNMQILRVIELGGT